MNEASAARLRGKDGQPTERHSDVTPDFENDGVSEPSNELPEILRKRSEALEVVSELPPADFTLDASTEPTLLTPPPSESTDEIGPAVIAHVDGVDHRGHIVGWAWVPARPECRVTVSAHIGDEAVSSGAANLPRQDVLNSGFGDGQYGYVLDLPQRLLDGRMQRLLMRFEASGVAPSSVEVELQLPRRGRQVNFPVANDASSPSVLAAATAAVYVPGQQVLCFSPHPLPPYHVQGWHEPEEEFTWIDGLEGVIELLMRRPQNSYTLMLDVVPNKVGDGLQTLEVFVNYFRMGFFEIREPTTVSVELPSEIFTMRRTRINLHCRNAINPSDYGVPDSRRLGLAVVSWVIT